MPDLVKKPNARSQLLDNAIEVPDVAATASEVLSKVQKNRKAADSWKRQHQKSLAKLKSYKKELDAAHKDVAGTKARDERLAKKWTGLADKIIRLQAAAKSGKGGKDPEKEIRALHTQAVAAYDEMASQFEALAKKYEKLSRKLQRGLNNLPY
ncbi:hypothetical protein SAMN05444007_103292 [Cribrihabitans marinus]|uniref:Uncharacterized protein n=1 Tax=Cribrihabitans marinus TaxID=1227549 RepID=A0A1H6W7P6_9RHOB|nr:hypothetical protein [Cribrihabitans marinus]GGH25097.1 hypothetical protein GCM10010973_12030 [Cribrihabitans marinus]SEJ08512.1 hypothetical protein SAMN05444007_103292 [Cribrihabitans marinus]